MSYIDLVLYLIIIASIIGILVTLGRKIPALSALSAEQISDLRKKKGIIQRAASKVKNVDYTQAATSVGQEAKGIMKYSKTGISKIGGLMGSGAGWIAKQIKSAAKLIATVMTKIKGGILMLFNTLKKFLKKRKENKDSAIGASEQPDILDIASEDVLMDKVSFKDQEKDLIEQAAENDRAEIIEEGRSSSSLASISLDELERPMQEEQKLIDVIVASPKNILAYKALGMFYYKQHNYADAKESLKTALQLGSKDKKIQEVLDEIGNRTNTIS